MHISCVRKTTRQCIDWVRLNWAIGWVPEEILGEGNIGRSTNLAKVLKLNHV